MLKAKRKGAVYLLFNDINSRYRFRAAKFTLEKGFVPTYPAMIQDFFEMRGEGKKGMDSRASLMRKCDQLWVFGDISASMWDQINTAKHQGKQVKYFRVYGGEFVEMESPS